MPIVISIPHCGTAFPEDIQKNYDEGLIQSPDDTDWYVDRLYAFAADLGITTIKSVYSRWVIDLNRDPESKPLYDDGRIITALVPETTFAGQPLYKTNVPDDEEIRNRISNYYAPYHHQLETILLELKEQFNKILLWEAHSIRQFVPTINPEKFPDLILGDADGSSASNDFSDAALSGLSRGHYKLSHNHPFKGGYITRKFGRPDEGVHALQLEMTKVNYMDDDEIDYNTERAARIQELLKATFVELISIL